MTSAQHPASLAPGELLKTCRASFGRTGGPGGQHRNKVETAVVLTHEPTGIEGRADERRSQAENHRVALRRLRINLALAVRTVQAGPLKVAVTPSELWQRRCHQGRIELNPHHEDFPAMLAEALDVLAAARYDPSRAAAILGCTSSQLVRLLKDEPRALASLNAHRRERGLRTLH